MTRLVTTAATGLASRTSRRGFLGRGGQLLLGVVGGSALLALMAGTAQAADAGTLSCSCSDPCLHWSTCACGTPARIKNHYDCYAGGVCSGTFQCTYSRCTNYPC